MTVSLTCGRAPFASCPACARAGRVSHAVPSGARVTSRRVHRPSFDLLDAVSRSECHSVLTPSGHIGTATIAADLLRDHDLPSHHQAKTRQPTCAPAGGVPFRVPRSATHPSVLPLTSIARFARAAPPCAGAASATECDFHSAARSIRNIGRAQLTPASSSATATAVGLSACTRALRARVHPATPRAHPSPTVSPSTTVSTPQGVHHHPSHAKRAYQRLCSKPRLPRPRRMPTSTKDPR